MPITRFAPSPTGHLHLGHAYAALFAARQAARLDGVMILRIEDIDPTRCRPAFTDAIFEDLAWLGLTWPIPVRRQSAHLGDYAAVLAALRARGFLYPCFCTRAEIAASTAAPHAPDPIYPGTCRVLAPSERAGRLAAGVPHAWRLDTARALALSRAPLTYDTPAGTVFCRPERFGDVVLARKDAPASYHLCVTHDDAIQGVTLVTRADDLQPVTDIHRLLQDLMNWPVPTYLFHPLITGEHGRRLAKRDGAPTLRAARASGLTPDAVRRRLGFESTP